MKILSKSTCLVFILLLGCNSKPPVDSSMQQAKARPVKMIEISQEESDQYLNYPAVIQSQKLSVLAFEVGGLLNELMVVEAQKVKKGDLLAKLDQRDLMAKRQSARAQYDNANTEYQRALRLIQEDAISRSEVERRKSQHDVTKSQLETAEKALQNSVLIAPYDGAIAKVSIEKREVIEPGKPAITILGREGLEAVFNLPSSVIARGKKHNPSDIESYIILDAAPDRRIPAKFKEASLEADPASQTYEASFAFKAPEDINILPGMNAVVWLKDPGKSSANDTGLGVPLTAIATDGDQKYVWVVDTNTMTVSKREVMIEENVGIKLGITNGLEPGEKIVAAGVSALSEGMKVSVWSK